jgi:stalled ribosome rescue protein Dom34
MGKKSRRGYPVALLVGMEEMSTLFWMVFSERVQHIHTLTHPRKRKNMEEKGIYHLHEEMINVLRPIVKEEVKSILLACPPKSGYFAQFQRHIQKHHNWLANPRSEAMISLAEIPGTASDLEEIKLLIEQPPFQEILGNTTSQEAEKTLQKLETALNQDSGVNILYGLKEIETFILKQLDPTANSKVFVLATNKFLFECPEKSRIQRVFQIAINKKAKTKVIDIESSAGERLDEFGGLVCIASNEEEAIKKT